MSVKEREDNLKIHGGGFGLFFMLTFSVFFLLMFFVGLFSMHNFREIVIMVLFGAICVYFTILTFKLWESNFIKLTSEKLIISVMDRTNLYRKWPKYNKKTIRLDEIEAVSLEKATKIYLAPRLAIKIKNSTPYYVDTKPFSKAAFWKLFKGFEKKGITVEVTVDAI